MRKRVISQSNSNVFNFRFLETNFWNLIEVMVQGKNTIKNVMGVLH